MKFASWNAILLCIHLMAESWDTSHKMECIIVTSDHKSYKNIRIFIMPFHIRQGKVMYCRCDATILCCFA